MKFPITLLFLFIFSFQPVWSQSVQKEAEQDSVISGPKFNRIPFDYNLQDQLVRQYKNNGAMVRTFDDRYEGVKGSPYLLNDFLPGVLVLHSGQSYENLQLRYQLMKQEVEYKTLTNPTPLVLDAEDIRLIIIKDKASRQDFIFEKKEVSMAKGRKPMYPHFITLYDKGSTLLVQPEKTFKKADYQGAYSSNKKYDEYKTYFAYFLRPKNQEKFIRVKLSNGSMLSALSDRKKELKAYIKAEYMDIDIEGEAVSLLEYYDSL